MTFEKEDDQRRRICVELGEHLQWSGEKAAVALRQLNEFAEMLNDTDRTDNEVKSCNSYAIMLHQPDRFSTANQNVTVILTMVRETIACLQQVASSDDRRKNLLLLTGFQFPWACRGQIDDGMEYSETDTFLISILLDPSHNSDPDHKTIRIPLVQAVAISEVALGGVPRSDPTQTHRPGVAGALL